MIEKSLLIFFLIITKQFHYLITSLPNFIHDTLNSPNIINLIDIEPKELFLNQFIHKRIFTLFNLSLSAFSQILLNLFNKHFGHGIRVFIFLLLTKPIEVAFTNKLNYLFVRQVVQKLLLVVCVELLDHVGYVLVLLLGSLAAD